jgi:pimeloyl-ACP methyl ester carboxylesterase
MTVQQFGEVRPPADARPDLALDSGVSVGGVDVRYSVSGEGSRDLVLVHGHGAHHLWWQGIAPLLEPHWRVIQMELSGHGDSGHRPDYSADVWSADVLAVLDAVGADRPVLVGHSMGGIVLLALAAAHPERAAGGVLLDARVFPPHRYRPGTEEDIRLSRPGAPPHGEPTQAGLLQRFRLMPPQPHPAPDVLEPVARFSTRETAAGWTWKHDRVGVTRMSDADIERRARLVRCPVALVHATESTVVDREVAEHTIEVTAGRLVPVPGAHHHLVLEQPDRCAELIDELASGMHRGA